MGFTEAVQSGFNKYVTFSGRALRSEYWWWVLFAAIVSFVANILDQLLHTARTVDLGNGQTAMAGGLITGIAALALLLPGLAVTVRRLHDTNRSGWWYLIVIIPIIGWIVMLYFLVIPGTPGTNRYGPPATGVLN